MIRLRLSSMSLWRRTTYVSLGLSATLAALAMAFEIVGWSRAADIVAPCAGWIMTLVLVWGMTALPWFWSGDMDFSEELPPHRRGRFLFILLWLPMIVVITAPTMMLIDALIDWLQGARWDAQELASPLWLFGIGITAAYGRMYNRAVQQRLRKTAGRARVCFHCAYSLAEIPNCTRCPECGHAVESSGVTAPAGGSDDATACD